MTKARKELTALRLDPAVLAALRAYKAREGTPATWVIETAVKVWLMERGAWPAPPTKTKTTTTQRRRTR